MKLVQTLLLTSVIMLGLTPLATVAQIKDNQVNAVVKALKQAAPPNSANDGMYSQWQVLPNIIPDWTKRCVGKAMTPQEFEKNQQGAEQTVSCIVKRELNNQYQATKNDNQSVKGVACWWMTGKYQGCDRGTTATYVGQVFKYYQQNLK